jgi:hypothetical protein
MISRETAKDRADRIPYDYDHQRDPQIRRRLLLSGGAMIAVLIWLAQGQLDREAGVLRASPGPLAGAHATWEAHCDACHTPPPGIRAALENRPYGVVSELGDARCKACHMGHPDQAHHRTRRADQVPHCATCHTEHRGSDVALIRRDEEQCTSCHGDLDSVRVSRPGPAPIDGAITHFFDGSHPPFRWGTLDPGRLKFNHALHMTKGLGFRKGDVPLVTFARLGEADHPRYGWEKGKTLDDPVQLRCASCHRLEGSEMIPITFENQCASCHSLALAAGDRGNPNDLFDVRHGVQPAALHDDLTARSILTVLSAPDGRLDPLKSQRIPGRRVEAESARREVERRVAAFEHILLGRGKGICTECHYYDSPDGQPVMRPDGTVDPARFQVAATGVPNSWFERARFDHWAHRGIDCRACHWRAYADDPEASGRPAELPGPPGSGLPRLKSGKETWTAHEDVLLPEITACQRCHAPARPSRSQPPGGARHDCVECHAYHNRRFDR